MENVRSQKLLVTAIFAVVLAFFSRELKAETWEDSALKVTWQRTGMFTQALAIHACERLAASTGKPWRFPSFEFKDQTKYTFAASVATGYQIGAFGNLPPSEDGQIYVWLEDFAYPTEVRLQETLVRASEGLMKVACDGIFSNEEKCREVRQVHAQSQARLSFLLETRRASAVNLGQYEGQLSLIRSGGKANAFCVLPN